ncbi:MAG: DUF1905 domain-containing protein [Deinococcales bacterium]|nr:DUF1905 domain-containing protein [Deinococcales bacterium]
MDLEFRGTIWQWRGPAPHYFVSVPAEAVDGLRAAARLVSYGWGMIPVQVRLGGTEWRTSLWPKDGGYIVPIKAAVRRAEAVDEGDEVTVSLAVGP